MYAENHPGIKQEEIAAHFQAEWSTVSKILKDKHKWLSVPENPAPIAKYRCVTRLWPHDDPPVLTAVPLGRRSSRIWKSSSSYGSGRLPLRAGHSPTRRCGTRRGTSRTT